MQQPPYEQWQQPPPYQQPRYYPPPQQPYFYSPPMSPDWIEYERRRAIAAKSYTNKAMITLLLYMFFFAPGFIANVIYLREAQETREITGVNPEGWGCLLAMLIVTATPILLFGVLFLIGTIAQATH